MNKIFYPLFSIILLSYVNASALKYGQGKAEKFGRTFNIGAGIGYFDYIQQPVPVITLNFEFDLVRNITLAPFISIYSFSDEYYWGNNSLPYKNYKYRQTVFPIGVKGAYYFDELTHLNKKWDFYSAFSVGLVANSVRWDKSYSGNKNYATHPDNIYLHGHIGARYHINSKAGIFLDLSTGVLLFGGSFKF